MPQLSVQKSSYFQNNKHTLGECPVSLGESLLASILAEKSKFKMVITCVQILIVP
jgi:hypothetical protein